MIWLAAVLLTQAPPGVEQVRLLARQGAGSALVEAVTRSPDDARDALRRLLAEAAGREGPADDSGAAAALEEAERLAAAYATAWHDSFFVRQVARFRSRSPTDRRGKAEADSLRLAGNAALGSGGVEAAMTDWWASLRRFETLADTAGIGAAAGNLGAGFYLREEFDSAEAYLRRSRELADAIGDYRTLGNALGLLGSVSKDRGDLRQARDFYNLAAPVRKRTGDARGLAADQNNLGLISRTLGDHAGARRAYEAALAANRSAGRLEPAATNMVNLGNLAVLSGAYREAAGWYRRALAIYRERGSLRDVAFVLRNLGLLAIRRGDYQVARATLTESADLSRRLSDPAEESAARADLATALAASGDLQAARGELRQAEALAQRGGRGEEALAGLALSRADLEVRFNRLREAERQYGRAERLARGAGSEATRAAAQQGIGIVLLRREAYAQAEPALELALRTQQVAGDSRGTALIRLLIGYTKRMRGDISGARQTLGLALDTLRAMGDAVGEATALGALGDLETQAGLALTAESLHRRGLSRLGARPAVDARWQLRAGLARALRSRGALAEAAQELRAAIAEIDSVTAGVSSEERRAAFLADKWSVYLDLALLERQGGRTVAAFEASERLRARQLLDLLARGRIAAGGDTGLVLTGQEVDLRKRIGELTRDLEAAEVGERGLRGGARSRQPEVGATREALALAQEAYADLLVELREARPEYAALVRSEVAPAPAIQAALGPDRALIEYLLADSTTIAFVITSDTLAAIDLNVSGRALAEVVDFARGILANPKAGSRGSWRAPMRRLYRQLFAPIETSGLLGDRRHLLMVPHGELHYLPFASLVRTGPPDQLLVERYVIEYAPSASVWLRLQGRSKRPPAGRVLAMAPQSRTLPGSRAEVDAIGRIYRGQARVLSGAEATERTFRALGPGNDIVHLATYGVLNKHNPLFSYIELGPGDGEDGRLEVHEVFGMNLGARLLVLSACQTGLAAGAMADVPAGDDWVGLVQAFLFSGASNVLATLWPVADVATARLMERFYRELASGRSEPEALAVMQREAARVPATAHPFYWAGFALVGSQ